MNLSIYKGQVWGLGTVAAVFLLMVTAVHAASQDAPFSVVTNSTTHFIVTEAGGVGVGTTAPSAMGTGGTPTLLQVSNSGTGLSLLNLTNADNSSGAFPGFIQFSSAALSGMDKRIAGIGAMKGDALTTNPLGSLVFYVANGGTMTEKMRITSAGNVGIGTTSPMSMLSVSASTTAPAFTISQATGTNAGDLLVFYSGTNSAQKVGSIRGLTPRIVATVTDSRLGVHSEGLAVSGRYAYVNDSSGNGLNVIDIADPLNPVIVGRVQDNIRLEGAEDVYVAGHYAYVTTEAVGANRFTIVDVENPTQPQVVGSVEDNARLIAGESVYVSGTYAYVSADDGNTFSVIDISTPTSPQIVGSITDATRLAGIEGIWVTGRYAYVVAESSDSLAVIDVSDPSGPVIAGFVQNHTLLDGASGIYVSGRYAYVSGELAGTMVVVDISNPASPAIVGSVTSSALLGNTDKLTAAGKYVYATGASTDTLVVIDVSTPSAPAIIASLKDSRLSSPIGVQVAGRYAYVVGSGWNNGGLDAFSVVELPGFDIPTVLAGDILTSSLKTWDNLDVGNSLNVRNGGVFGSGGISSNGPGYFSAFSTATPSKTFAVSGTVTDNAGSSVRDAFNLVHMAGSSAGNNIGTGLLFSAEDASGNATSTAQIAAVLTSVSTASPSSVLTFSTKNTTGELTERLRIDSSGNMGLGTMSPGSKLDIAGSVRVGTAAAPKGITLYDTSTSQPYCVQVTNGALALSAGVCAN